VARRLPDRISIGTLAGAYAPRLTQCEFRCRYPSLTTYNYAGDRRFGIPEILALSPREAVDAVVISRYPYSDPAPFGVQRMSEIFTGLCKEFPALARGSLKEGQIEDCLRTLLSAGGTASVQPAAALIWLLGERRKRTSSGVLIEVLKRSAPGAESRLHFVEEEAALTNCILESKRQNKASGSD
jgi:hypothetical protein